MNTTQKREAKAWGKAAGFLALMLVTSTALVLAGLYAVGGQ